MKYQETCRIKPESFFPIKKRVLECLVDISMFNFQVEFIQIVVKLSKLLRCLKMLELLYIDSCLRTRVDKCQCKSTISEYMTNETMYCIIPTQCII